MILYVSSSRLSRAWTCQVSRNDYHERVFYRVKNEIGHIFTLLVLILVEKGFVTLEVEYLDGT
ncbi:hypothetical protein, partial [Parabacteroides johnsonii]|uniref:hypothetical protein n=1 Tax=Parabacteroides johnsonii TaxID=387661 RepID=UPI0011DCCD07